GRDRWREATAMSAEFFRNDQLPSNVLDNLRRSPVRHIMVCLHGHQDQNGEPLPPLDDSHPLKVIPAAVRARMGWKATGSDNVFTGEKQRFEVRPEDATSIKIMHWKSKIKAKAPSNPVQAAVDFIKQNFDPRAFLIVAGSSAGGLNAIEVCRELENNWGHFA